jgi:hypothetical protein
MWGDCPEESRMIIPGSLIDNKPVEVRVQLPAAWLAREFAEWLGMNAEAFAEHMLANEGVRLEWSSASESTASGETKIIFQRS